MFRAHMHIRPDGPTLKMEGRLVGNWARHTRLTMTDQTVPPRLVVDLTDITYVDSVGEEVLAWFASIGATFASDAVYGAEVCERLQLPVHRRFSVTALA